MSTWNGSGTKLYSVTRRNEQGQNYRVLFSVWMDMPITPLERHLIGNYTVTSFSNTRISSRKRIMRTEYSYQDLGTSRVKFQEVLLVYFFYWVLGPVLLLGPGIVVFEALWRFTPLYSSSFGFIMVVFITPLAIVFPSLLVGFMLWHLLYEKWERGSYRGLDFDIESYIERRSSRE